MVKTTLDGLGRTIKVETGDTSGVQSVVDTVYDSCACSPLGKVKQVSLPHAPNATAYWTTYAYDALGRTLTVTAADGSVTSTLHHRSGWRIVGAESILDLSTDAVVRMTIFDARGRPIREALYDADDRVIRRVAFRYDARELLPEEEKLVGASIRDDFRNAYRCDASGRPIEADSRVGRPWWRAANLRLQRPWRHLAGNRSARHRPTTETRDPVSSLT